MKVLVPVVFGVLMVAAVAYRADGPALVAAVASLAAVGVSAWWRPAATVAVLLTVAAAALDTTAPMATALAGLAAAAYLVLRHGNGRATPATMLTAVAFALVATAVLLVPVAVPWLPLAAPLALLAVYVLALRPYP
ncbi:hypothetical protein ACQI4L_25465 [Mycolicibacterium litorale]|uniref:hypothetical protein n=1 Tax=Mycolicibacterium litorale TaxID=758802 RepID=UPI003CE7F8A5